MKVPKYLDQLIRDVKMIIENRREQIEMLRWKYVYQ